MELPTEAQFAIKHGDNTTNRLEPELLQAIYDHLTATPFMFRGKQHQIKMLGEIDEGRDGTRLIFDVKDVDGFDHIEFKVQKTGWGRAL